MINKELDDLVGTVALKEIARDFQDCPLTKDEVEQIRDFCRRQLCNGDLPEAYKKFYVRVIEVIGDKNEIQKP